jgi:hypothetical protein
LLDQKGRKNQGPLKALPFGHLSKKQPARGASLLLFVVMLESEPAHFGITRAF